MSCECDRIGCNVFDNLSFSVIVIDKDYNVVSMNNRAKEHLENNTRDAEGCVKCYALTHRRDKPCYLYDEACPVKECLETKKFSRAVHKHFYNDEEVFEEITATPVLDGEGNIKYIIEELRDISKLLKLETVINSLRTEVKTLQGILPICAGCKRIRDDKGYWSQVEKYISTRTEAKFSHSLCPDCLSDLYPEIAKRLEEKKDQEDKK
jgi:transcriptional regulator with PAS, ATPase and Fis domain